jgi:hypothetical protein
MMLLHSSLLVAISLILYPASFFYRDLDIPIPIGLLLQSAMINGAIYAIIGGLIFALTIAMAQADR